MLDMDGETFRRHFRLTRQQYEVLNGKLTETGGELNTELGGPTRIPQNIKTFSFLRIRTVSGNWVKNVRLLKVQHMMSSHV